MYVSNPKNNIQESKVMLSIWWEQTLMNNNLYLQYFLAVIYKLKSLCLNQEVEIGNSVIR